jgi:hypothetical protein
METINRRITIHAGTVIKARPYSEKQQKQKGMGA